MNAKLPLDIYLIIAPGLLIGFFIYKQLYLYKTNKLIKYAIAQCKSNNQDSCGNCKELSSNCTLERMCKRHLSRLYPWIIIYCRLMENRSEPHDDTGHISSLISKLQQHFVNFSLWWLLPIILLILTGFVIRMHDNLISNYMLAVTCLGIAVAAFFYCQQQKLLSQSKSMFHLLRERFVAIPILLVLMAVGINIIAFQGRLPLRDSTWPDNDEKIINSDTSFESNGNIPWIVKWLLKRVRGIAFANLSYQTITENSKNDLPIWIDLQESHFEGANLSEAYLKKADLRWAYLDNAHLRETILEMANLEGVVAKRADFNSANLKHVKFKGSDVSDAKFADANITNAVFDKSNLQGADFTFADLSGADLSDSNATSAHFNNANLSDARLSGLIIDNADFSGANLQNARMREVIRLQAKQLMKANNYLLAYYDEDGIESLGLKPDHNVHVEEKNFSGYNFCGANLSRANLKDADVTGALFINTNLSHADLQGAIMTGAELFDADLQKANLRGIIAENGQFSYVKTLYQAQMEDDLRDYIKINFAHLLVQPPYEKLAPLKQVH